MHFLEGPGIILSEQKKFVLRVPGKLLVDVGCTVYAVKGAQITVSCRANSTNGATKIEWFKDGFPVKERFEANVAARLGSLTIRVLNRFNEGTYTCKASSSEGVTEALFTAKIAGELRIFQRFILPRKLNTRVRRSRTPFDKNVDFLDDFSVNARNADIF